MTIPSGECIPEVAVSGIPTMDGAVGDHSKISVRFPLERVT